MMMPKVATVSIRHALNGSLSTDSDERGWRWHDVDHVIGSAYARFLRIGFVRNPFDRLVSCWKDKVNDQLHRTFAAYGICQDMRFRDFVDHITGFSPQLADKHWRSQSYEYMRDGQLVPAYLCRLETLEEDWRALRQMPSMNVMALDHYHRTDRAPYRSYYDLPTRQKVASYYAEDLEVFGYVF